MTFFFKPRMVYNMKYNINENCDSRVFTVKFENNFVFLQVHFQFNNTYLNSYHLYQCNN